MKDLIFSYNWNRKLDNLAFTTMRLVNQYEVGDEVKITLNENGTKIDKGTGLIIDIKRLNLSQLNEWTARIDTGYSLIECKKILMRMYKNKSVNWKTQIIRLILIQKSKKA